MDWLKKWTWGFFFGAAAFGVLVWVPETLNGNFVDSYRFGCIGCAGIGRLWSITAFSIPVLMLSFLPTALFNYLSLSVMPGTTHEASLLSNASGILFLIIGIIVGLVYFFNKRKQVRESGGM